MSENDNVLYGPVLPQTHEEEKVNPEEQCLKNDTYGPSLPPHLQKSKIPTKVCIGPTLPPHLREQLCQNEEDYKQESSEEEEVYGPILPGQDIKSSAQIALEERALEIKLKQLDPDEQKVGREEWMTELPTVSASKLGLGPRQFRPNAGPDMSDRSSWTDTPSGKKQNKEPTVNLKEEREKMELKKRDKEQEKLAKAHKRESKSLVELHQKKIKKSSAEAPVERTPFNRETDLKVNRFDEAQKAAVLKKAQLLDDRFSQGKSKFL